MCSLDCQCLPGPKGTFCGWVGRADGIVHPCDPSCCQPKCQGLPPSELGEYKRTYGTSLPPTFGQYLKTSDRATVFKYEAPFDQVGPSPEPAYERRFFWLVFLICFMVLMAVFLV